VTLARELRRLSEHASAAGHEQDAPTLHDQLDTIVLPLDHADRDHRIWMMKAAISEIAYCLDGRRMMRWYTSEAYIR
jgi:hypothetical protein